MLDFIGIGLGPFNLSLASLLQEKSQLNYLFFERKSQFDWHAGIQLPNTVLQVPFMADLVSMVDPTSPYSFLNYLKHQQRLYKFYFLEQPHIPRREYNHYCQWVAAQLSNIQYDSTVVQVKARLHGFEVTVEQDGIHQVYQCRHLVLGTGTSPLLPDLLQELQRQYPEQCLHSAQYLQLKHEATLQDVAVIGSGQSAAEVFMDLFDRQFEHDRQTQPVFELHWLTRSDGFFPMEYAPLGLEHFSPDYGQFFYRLENQQKQRLLQRQGLLHKGISANTIKQIYQKMYHRSIGQSSSPVHLHVQSELIHAEKIEHGKIRLYFQHKLHNTRFYLDCDLVIAATGYGTPSLQFLQPLLALMGRDEAGQWQVDQYYRLQYQGQGQIYVQNLEFSSHGVVTPDLGMGAHRAAIIANQLMGQAYYELPEQAQCFQHFDLHENPRIHVLEKSDTQAPLMQPQAQNVGSQVTSSNSGNKSNEAHQTTLTANYSAKQQSHYERSL